MEGFGISKDNDAAPEQVSDFAMLEINNPEVSPDHRQVMRERLKQALFSTPSTTLFKMPPERAAGTAAKIEESVFVATLTKIDYERMIETRINYIRNKISTPSGATEPNSPSSSASSSGIINEGVSNITSPTSSALKYLGDEEKQYVITKLAPLQVHLPKMERLIDLFKQHQLSQSNMSMTTTDDWSESLKKYIALKGVLQKQIELFSQDSYILTPVSANSLVEHVQKMTNLLVTRARTFLLPASGQTTTDSNRKIKKAKPLIVSIELPNFNPEYIDEEKLERQLADLNPQPSLKKVIMEKPFRYLVYLGANNCDFLVKFTVIAGREIIWQIERGKEYFKCAHDIIGERNFRVIWRHLMFHYSQSIKNKLSNT